MSDALKKQAADAALLLVEPGMTLGLGTGSTAAHFIRQLSARVRDGLDVRAVHTSVETRRLADAEGIEAIEPDETTIIDLAVDGADEIDPDLNCIKGGGGALLREKIVAVAADRFVLIADASKRVAQLGAFPLPVEIDTAYWPMTVRAIREALHAGDFGTPKLALRGQSKGFTGGPAFITDGGHYIVDIEMGRISDAPKLEAYLRSVPGVVETGLFIDLADDVFYASAEGVEHITRP